MYHEALKRVPPLTPEGDVNVFVETPAGSDHKLDLDHESGLLRWALELPRGLTFPFAFGFVPNTLAEDGDALDIVLLLHGTVPAGTLVVSRLIGVLRVMQDEIDDGSADTRNDRVIAVPTLANSYSSVQDIGDLRDNYYEELAAFFRRYNEMIDRAFDHDDPADAETARTLLEESIARAERKA